MTGEGGRGEGGKGVQSDSVAVTANKSLAKCSKTLRVNRERHLPLATRRDRAEGFVAHFYGLNTLRQT